jgi:hypothetical protein
VEPEFKVEAERKLKVAASGPEGSAKRVYVNGVGLWHRGRDRDRDNKTYHEGA